MRTIRNSVFETNSSSCHVLTVADQNEYDLIKNGQAVITCHIIAVMTVTFTILLF